MKNILMTALLSLSAGHALVAEAQQPGPGGPPTSGGMQPMGVPGPGIPSQDDSRNLGRPGRDAGVPGGLTGDFNRDFTRMPSDMSGDRGLPGAPPNMPQRVTPTRVVPLSDVVAQVQERFNATAVKTDSVVGLDGRVSYRIRLLSADKSRVWTVSVDASTGQVK